MLKLTRQSNNKEQSKYRGAKSANSFTHFTTLPVIGMFLSVILFSLGYVLFVDNTSFQQEQLQQLEASASLNVQQINQTMEQLQQTLENAADDSELADSILRNANDELEKHSARYKKLIPHSTKIQIYPIGTASVDSNSFPPLRFSTLDAIHKAEAGEPIAPEVISIDNKNILNWATPVKRNEKTIGTIVAFFNFNEIFKHIVVNDDQRLLLQITQQFKDGKPNLLMSSGNTSLQESTIHSEQVTTNPNWKITYFAAHTDLIATLLDFLPPVFIAFVLGICATYISLHTTQKVLRKDSALLLSHVEELKFGQYSRQPEFNTYFIQSLDHTLTRIFEDFDQQMTTENTRRDQDVRSHRANRQSAADSQSTSLELPEDLSKETKEFAGHGLPSAQVDEQLELPDIPERIFRAYDIRGIVDQDITEDTIRLLGKAIGSEAKEQGEDCIFVGRDGRNSSPALCRALIEGLLSTGINVTNVGLVPTPVLWFACHTEEASRSGVMVTGSHNPAEYNGLKIMIAGDTLCGEKVIALRDRIMRNSILQGNGIEQETDIKQRYISYIAEDVILATPMTIVLDSGNGAAGEIGPALFEELGCNVIPLFSEIDGNFPNHHPDPSREENLEALKQAVAENSAELGIAFDGDGDRIGIVTPSGKVIWPDRLMMLYAKDLLVRNPGADIIFDVKCSRRLPELITNLGGRPCMWKTGHSMIKGKLKDLNAALAGEMSGHIFFNDRWFGFDDALYCGARLLEILSTESEDVEQVFAELPEGLSTPEILIPVPEERKFQIVKALEEKGQFGKGNISTIDGIRVDFPKAWGLIRASNTTPALTARFEAENEEALEQIQALFQKQLHQVDENIIINS